MYIESLTENSSKEEVKDVPDIIHKKSSGGDSQISQSVRTALQGKIVTSIRTPMKGEHHSSDFSVLEQDQYSRRNYKTSTLGRYNVSDYSPSGYMLKVELTLVKIALMLLRSMHLILKNEIRSGRDSEFLKELNYYHDRTSEKKLFVLSTSIFDCIHFCLN